MSDGWIRFGFGKLAMLALGSALVGAGEGRAQAPAPAKTNLKKVLLLEKNQVGNHVESRRDLNAALAALAAEKGFTLTTIAQNDPASKIATEFSAASLATYQAVIFSNNDGVHAQLSATEKANFEAYVKGGGGFIPVHAASAFISNWSWISTVLVESFFGPHGSNQPTANVIHDADGLKEGTETKGIFKGLTAPLAFLDEYYSFRTSPRGRAGVTVLLRVDEATFSKPVDGPMGSDHPVVWSKTDGKGRVVHMSMGHSWSFNNVYTAKNAYLKGFLYGSLRFVAGDFTGCTDPANPRYNPDATKSDPTACASVDPVAILRGARGGLGATYSVGDGKAALEVSVRSEGTHELTVVDMAGRTALVRRGSGPCEYSLPKPSRSGLYLLSVKAGGKESRHRLTVL